MKRTTKSIIAFVVLVAMCVSFCVPAFAEADHDHGTAQLTEKTCPLGDKTHTLAAFGLENHDWTATPETDDVKLIKVVSMGCEEDGYTIYQCKACEVMFVDSWVKGENNGHQWGEYTVKKEATCTEAGESVRECSVCGKKETIYPAALGHDYDADNDGVADWIYSNPNYICSDEGVEKWQKCTVCGEETAKVAVNATEHKWVINIDVQPTCVTVGHAFYACENCTVAGEVEVPMISKDDPAAHKWEYSTKAEDGYVAPTCQVPGKAENAKCALCGAEAAVLELTTDHEFVNVKEEAATCDKSGVAAHVACKFCGEYSEEYKEKNEDGELVNKDLTIPALNHPEKDRTYYNELYKAATCATNGEGLKVFDCAACNGKKIEEVIPRLEHPATQNTYVAPTCDKFGYNTDACLVCGEYTKFEMIPPYSHDPENPNNKLVLDEEASTAVTCQNDGENVYTCGECGVTVKVPVEKKPHNYVDVVTPNTCAADGYTMSKCEWCGDVDYTADKDDEKETTKDGKFNWVEADPDAHAKKTHWTTHPTCTKTGLSLTFCTVCDWIETDENGKNLYKVVPALGHDATAWNAHECKDEYTVEEKNGKVVTSTVAATCTVDKYDIWNCDLCGLQNQKDYYANTKLGHNYVDEDGKPIEANIVREVGVTCTTDGYIVVKCERFDECGTLNTDDRCAACDTESCKVKTHDSSDEFVTEKLGHSYDFSNVIREDFPQCKDDPATTWNEKVGRIWTTCENECGTENYTTSLRNFDINDDRCHVDAKRDDTKPHRPATCAERGIEYWYCEACGEDFGKILPKPEHTQVGPLNPGSEPTCLTDGKAPFYVCTECNQEITVLPDGRTLESYKAPGKHDFKPADCENASKCSRCGTEDATKPALGHKWVAATCVAAEYCSVCNETKGDKLGHDYLVNPVVVDPTCTAGGYTYNYCGRCYEMWNIRDYTYALGHDSTVVNTEKTKAPTCTQAGVNVYDCARCDAKETKSVDVPALTEDLKHVNAAGEKFGDVCDGVTTDYTCTTEGCGFKETDKIHNYVSYDVKGDCLVHVYDLAMCSRCNKHKLTDLGQFDEHDWSEAVIIKPATLTEDGLKQKTCKRCQAKSTPESYSANAGVQFDFDIQNLRGESEVYKLNEGTENEVTYEKYAGGIKLVINLSAKDIKASNILLNVKFSNNVIFRGGKLLSEQFTQYDDDADRTFTNADTANENGYVIIFATSKDDVDVNLANGAFAELYFDIKVNAINETVSFTVDKDGSNVSNTAEEKIVELYPEATVTAKTTRIGNLSDVDVDAKMDGNDAIKLRDYIKSFLMEKAYTSVADLNKDGEINGADYALMQKIILENFKEGDIDTINNFGNIA